MNLCQNSDRTDLGTSERPHAPQCQECRPWSSLDEGMLVIMMDDDMQSDDGIGGFPRSTLHMTRLYWQICWWQLP